MGDPRSDVAQRTRAQARRAGQSKWARYLVLAGWAAKGVVYVALAWLVLQMALGSAPQQASTQGALEYIASTAPGSIALILLGCGLFAFAVGRILEVTVLATSAIEAKDKAQAVVLAVLYAALAISAFSIVGLAGGSGGSASGGGSSQQKGAAILLDLPAGQLLVGLVGVAVAAFGAFTIYKGIKERFLGTLRTADMSSTVRTWSTRLGTAAYVTKGAIFIVFGWFLVQAAVTYNPNQAKGLDGSLREIADTGWGPVLLAVIAAGLLAYGLFCGIEARYRRVGSSASGTT